MRIRTLIQRWIRAEGHQPAAEDGTADSFLRKHRGSAICMATEGVLGGLLALLGLGFPDQGDGLHSSGSVFDGVSAQLAALGPDGGWRGNAAQAYGARNLAQSQHTILMADLDRGAAELVLSQAEAVKKVRDGVRAELGIVLVLLVVCLGLESQGPDAQLVSFYIATVACCSVLLLTGIAVVELAVTTSRNASAVQTATQRLTAMVAALTTGSDTVAGPPEITMPPTPSLSEFDLADSSAASSHIPDLSSDFTDLPGAPEFHLATGAGVGFPDFGAPQLPITALTGLPTLPTIAQLSTTLRVGFPDFGAPQLPITALTGLPTLPTIAQLSTTLSQLTNLAGPTSAVSQPAQQHTSPADHRTRDDDTDTPDTDAATAGTTSSGERTPLGSTTQPTQQHQKLAV
ncbi:EspA/EspE family type VII secretion system effector [Mycobacterium marinum]|uniref:EspA/EspE family type VII secretion system effector n=1 Tax=Mycobacterium marinum TaxID=1781 RepID=UPI001FB71AAA|nr:EspA/EspE family type VII secretion system effector [Mycobacterium marinum]